MECRGSDTMFTSHASILLLSQLVGGHQQPNSYHGRLYFVEGRKAIPALPTTRHRRFLCVGYLDHLDTFGFSIITRPLRCAVPSNNYTANQPCRALRDSNGEILKATPIQGCHASIAVRPSMIASTLRALLIRRG